MYHRRLGFENRAEASYHHFRAEGRYRKRLRRLVQRADWKVRLVGHVLDLRIPQRCLYCAEGALSTGFMNRSAREVLGPIVAEVRPDIDARSGALRTRHTRSKVNMKR